VEYKILTEIEKADIVSSFLRSQEVDHYCHSLNAERYKSMLSDPDFHDGEFKERIKALLAETESRLAEVNNIIKHTE